MELFYAIDLTKYSKLIIHLEFTIGNTHIYRDQDSNLDANTVLPTKGSAIRPRRSNVNAEDVLCQGTM